MFIPGQNKLAAPDAVVVPPFEQQLQKFKIIVIDHIAQTDPAMAQQVAETLNNKAELSTKLVEACTVVLQTRIREVNEDALQMFAYWAEGNNLDVKVSDLGLKRQTISPGDPNAFPQVPPTMESDDALKLRYWLAPYSFSNAGPRLGYKYHAMTLGERPTVTVESPEAGKIVVTYQISTDTQASKVKDASGVKVGAGKVKVPVLSREGNGTASPELLAAVSAYFERDDVAPTTDEVEPASAEILPYTIHAIAYINRGPDAAIAEASARQALANYANQQHRLKALIDPGKVKHVLYSLGAEKVDLQHPAEEIQASELQAPFCTDIHVEIKTL